jgi:CheY-like chemotaxis protein
MATSAPGGTPVVLIADDHADIRTILSVVLKDEGYGVIEAVDGQDALDLALARAVDLILLDLNMPRLGGQAFCEAYRGRAGRAPVLLLTAANFEDTVAAVATCNAAGHIRKPFDLQDVLDTIERHVGRP